MKSTSDLNQEYLDYFAHINPFKGIHTIHLKPDVHLIIHACHNFQIDM